jgi:hypothetical protein
MELMEQKEATINMDEGQFKDILKAFEDHNNNMLKMFLEGMKSIAVSIAPSKEYQNILIELRTLLKQHLEQYFRDKKVTDDHLHEAVYARDKINKAFEHAKVCEEDKCNQRLIDVEGKACRIENYLRLIIGIVSIETVLLVLMGGEKILFYLSKIL